MSRVNLDLWSDVSEEADAIRGFIGWLVEEHGFDLVHSDSGMGPSENALDRLIKEFLGVDLDGLEKERRELLASAASINEGGE